MPIFSFLLRTTRKKTSILNLNFFSDILEQVVVDKYSNNLEKGIEIVARYHCPKEYFVEVTTEKSVLAGRDYWLCKKNSPRKVFMFSGKFKNEDQEVHQIIDQLKSSVKKYEQL